MSTKATFQHAFAGLPRHKKASDLAALLPLLKAKGYTGIWVENDYFRLADGDPMLNPGFGDNWTLFDIFHFTRSRYREAYLAYLRELAELCATHGLALCMSFWIPRINSEFLEQLQAENPAAVGVATGYHQTNGPTLCSCQGGAGLQVLSEMIETLFTEVPSIWGLKVATEDNNALLCDDCCPNAAGSTRAEHAGNLYATVQQALRRVKPDARLVVYPWFWEAGYVNAVCDRLEDDYLVLTKYESGSLQHLESAIPPEPIFDSSIVSDAPGTHFLNWSERVGAERIIDMVPVGTGIDDHFLANPPYPGRLARRLRALQKAGVCGFLDFECGGYSKGTAEDVVRLCQEEPDSSEVALLERLAAERSDDPEVRAHTVRGWQAFDLGFGVLPVGLGGTGRKMFSGRIGFSWSLCIATPLFPEYIGEERRHEIYWWSPYNLFSPSLAPRLGFHFLKVLTHWQEADRALSIAAALAGTSESAQRDAIAARAHLLSLRSVVNFCQAPVLQQSHPELLPDLMRNELEVTRQFVALYREHPWIWVNNCWHPHRTPLSQKLGLGVHPAGTDAFEIKLKAMECRTGSL